MAMMVSYLNSVLIGFLFFSSTVDATVRESVEVKVYDPNFRMSDQKMLDMLQKVDLESHGYKVENTTKMVNETGSRLTIFRKSILYYKVVNCSRLREINQELQTLLPAGILELEMVEKFNSEITRKNLTKMKQCRVGLQIHFNSGCSRKKRNVLRRRGCSGHFICITSQSVV